MATKINLQQLAKLLAQKKNLPQRDAEAFLKEFFDAIIQNVTTDKLVKIKGLGTFKLIEVHDRESVNVNTGERIVIPGHTKLSFTPENALKDLINKPFADFQAVVINDGTDLEEMEKVPAQSQAPQSLPEEDIAPEDDEEAETTPEPVQAFASISEPEENAEEEPKSEPQPELKEEPEQEVAPEPISEQKSEPAPEPKPESIPASEPKSDDAKKPHSIGKIAIWTGCLLLLCLLCFFVFRTLSDSSSMKENQEQVIESQTEAPVEEAPAPKVEYAQVPGGEYRIVGTRKTHVMKPGEFITRIAIEEYGNKDFAPYIIVHNAFPDPDNVPVDMEIKLPELEKIE